MTTFLKLIEKNPLKSTGSSMLPIFQPGDWLYFKKVGYRNLKVDDIALVRTRFHSYFVHRILYKSKKYAVTKGDNNLFTDGKINPKRIIAKVIKIKRDNNILSPTSLYLVQSSYYLNEIIKIKDEFDRNQIKYVFLKGLPIHLYYEKSHPKRVYADCDILIDETDAARAKAILRAKGYRSVGAPLIKTLKKTNHPEVSYQKSLRGFPVNFDIHTEAVFLMTQLGKLDSLYPQKLVKKLTQELLHNKKTVKIDGHSYKILDNRYLILYLLLHFFHHNYKGIFRLELISIVIKQSRLGKKDWEFLSKKINEYQLSGYIYPALLLLRKYYNNELPASFLRLIKKKPSVASEIVGSGSIFGVEDRMTSGINRFINIFRLSESPTVIKLTVLLNPEIIFYVVFVLKERLSRSLRGSSKNHQGH